MTKRISIGGLSKRTGVHIETIRYYEKIALLPKPDRSAGGHRLYDTHQLKRLHFIQRSRKLGFTLDEIRSLLTLVDGGNATCSEVQAITLTHLNDIQRKIADLKTLEQVLGEMAEQCETNVTPDCPVLEVLYDR